MFPLISNSVKFLKRLIPLSSESFLSEKRREIKYCGLFTSVKHFIAPFAPIVKPVDEVFITLP